MVSKDAPHIKGGWLRYMIHKGIGQEIVVTCQLGECETIFLGCRVRFGKPKLGRPAHVAGPAGTASSCSTVWSRIMCEIAFCVGGPLKKSVCYMECRLFSFESAASGLGKSAESAMQESAKMPPRERRESLLDWVRVHLVRGFHLLS